jgi:uncharacterized protein (DUF433 family)
MLDHDEPFAVIDGSSTDGCVRPIEEKTVEDRPRLPPAQYRGALSGPAPDNQATTSGEEPMAFDRITVEPDKLEGKPCIRGLRITVETVVRLVAAGWTFEQILEEYPDLERADIQQALEYAAAATDVHVHRLRSPA